MVTFILHLVICSTYTWSLPNSVIIPEIMKKHVLDSSLAKKNLVLASKKSYLKIKNTPLAAQVAVASVWPVLLEQPWCLPTP